LWDIMSRISLPNLGGRTPDESPHDGRRALTSVPLVSWDLVLANAILWPRRE
jgi:hypothetical protein